MRYRYMFLTGRHTCETDFAVVSDQMMQHIFMRNVTRVVLYIRCFGTDCSNFAMRN